VRKISLTLPDDLLDEAQQYAPDGNISAYVADGLRRRVEFDRARQLLRELDDEWGPIPQETREKARRTWQDTPFS
jgi:hypothetical protein